MDGDIMNEYSIKELMDVLNRGAEIEFMFKNEKYSISHSNNKIILTKHSNWANYEEFGSALDLVTQGKIGDKPFESIWQDVLVIMWF